MTGDANAATMGGARVVATAAKLATLSIAQSGSHRERDDDYLRRSYTPTEAALALAEAGLPVFPCGADKQPLTPRGFKDATADAEAIAAWWRRWPDALPAVPTGRASGLFVVDADLDKETGEALGEASLAAFGLTPADHAHAVPTRSGGWHFVFPWAEGLPGNTAKRLPGVDTRGEGGYVIAWEPDVLIAAHGDPWAEKLPSDVLAALTAKERRREEPPRDDAHAPRGGFRFDDGGCATAWAEKALAEEITAVRAAMVGGRNDALNAAAFNLGQLVGGGRLDRARVEAELFAAALAIGLGQEEAGATIRSGLTSGMAQPRRPPGETGETDETRRGPGFGGSVGRGNADAWPSPDMTLMRPERGAAPKLPLEAVFGPIWGRWISEAADAKGAPPDYVAAAVLATAGSLIGNARWVAPWAGWAEPPIVWAVLIGPPSAGKSPALDAALAPLRAVERRLRRDAERNRAAWAEKAEAAALARAAWKADATKALKDGGDPPSKPAAADPGPEPHVPRLAVNDATVERLAVILAKQPRGLLVVRDELAGWLANMSRYANGGSDKPFWLEAYGGCAFTVERMSREPVRVERLTVAALGGIQPDRLASLLIKADDDGMLARLVPVWPEPAPVKRPEAAPDEAFAEEAFARLYGLAMPTGEDGEPRPWFIPFAEPARAIMDDFRRWAREEEAREAGLMQSFIGKFPGLAARLALILAHLDWAATPGAHPPEDVTAGHFGRAACYIADYALPMARRAYAEASAPPEERAAQRLARLMVDERWETFTLRDVTRRERQGLRRNAEVEPALDVLTQAGWIRADRQASGPKGGRPQLLFRVNPAVRGVT